MKMGISNGVKIGIDIQPLQTVGSRERGIGRYVHSLLGHISQQVDIERFGLFYNRALEMTDGVDSLSKMGYPLYPLNGIDKYPPPNNAARPRYADKEQSRIVERQLIDLEMALYHLTSPYELEIYQPRMFSEVKVIYTVYDLIPLIFYQHYLLPAKPHFKKVYAKTCRLLKKADRIMAISKTTKDDLVKYLDIDPKIIDVIHLGVDDRFKVLKNPRSKFVVGDYILWCGGVDMRKNAIGMMNAYHKLPIHLKKRYKLVMVCRMYPPNKTEPLYATAKSLGIDSSVIFTDYVSDEELVSIYNMATVFVFPSLYEGFGLPVLEAMACGTPVIASNTSSIPEVAGDAAIYVNPESVDEIASAMECVLNSRDIRKRLREKGLKNAGQFTWENAAIKTIRTYDKLLSNKQITSRGKKLQKVLA